MSETQDTSTNVDVNITDSGTLKEITTTGDSRPDWLKDKFKSVEDQARAYVELEKLLGKRQGTPAPTETPETPETPSGTPSQTPAPTSDLGIPERPAAPKGVDMAALEAEITRDGKLSDATRADLESRGVPPEAIEVGLKARVETYKTAVVNAAGGQEAYQQMVQWAAGSLSAAEQAAFNKAVGSGDPAMAQLAVEGLRGRFKAAQEPNLSLGGKPRDTRVKPWENEGEMLAAVRDPRYRNRSDPEFIRWVEARTRASTQNFR